VAITGAAGMMRARVWALLLATVRGTYWRQGLCEVRTGDRGFVRYVGRKGLCEVRTAERAL